MNDTGVGLAFYVFCGLLLTLVTRGIVSGRHLFTFPTLAAMLGVAWIVPQGTNLETDPANIYRDGAFWIYVTGCFIAIFWGFQAGCRVGGRRKWKSAPLDISEFDLGRLLLASAAVTALGYLAQIQIRGIDVSEMGSQWTGIITMWALLTKAGGFGLCLAVIVFSKTKSQIALAIATVAALPYISSAFDGVRRESLFDLVILTAGTWYISRGRLPPRIAVITSLLIGTVVLNTVGDIRNRVITQQESFFSVILSADTYRNYNFFRQGDANELRQAQFDFWYANDVGEFSFGADYYNALITQYVPAFIFGRDFKEGLKVQTAGERISRGLDNGVFSFGSTRTGFSDSYRNFGIFGVLAFAAIGYFFGIMYVRTTLGGIIGTYYYLILLAEGLKAITHSTSAFVIALPFTIIISHLAFVYARRKGSSADMRV